MLPTNICEHCTYKLDMLYEFREASRKSEIILKRYLSNADYMSKDAQVSTVRGIFNPLNLSSTNLYGRTEG